MTLRPSYTSTGPVWKLRIDKINDMHCDFLSGVYCASETEANIVTDALDIDNTDRQNSYKREGI